MKHRLVPLLIFAFLAGWPVLLGRYVLNAVPVPVLMGLWAVTISIGGILLMFSHRRYLTAQGRGWSESRVGLGGKQPGLILPRAIVPTGIAAFVVIFAARPVAVSPAIVVVAGVAMAKLAFDYLRIVLSERRQTLSLLKRSGRSATDDVGCEVSAECMEAVDTLSKELGIPADKLRLTDRFGYELGSLSYFDQQLDRLGGKLRRRYQELGQSIDLGRILTVRDYIRAWCAARDSSEADGRNVRRSTSKPR